MFGLAICNSNRTDLHFSNGCDQPHNSFLIDRSNINEGVWSFQSHKYATDTEDQQTPKMRVRILNGVGIGPSSYDSCWNSKNLCLKEVSQTFCHYSRMKSYLISCFSSETSSSGTTAGKLTSLGIQSGIQKNNNWHAEIAVSALHRQTDRACPENFRLGSSFHFPKEKASLLRNLKFSENWRNSDVPGTSWRDQIPHVTGYSYRIYVLCSFWGTETWK